MKRPFPLIVALGVGLATGAAAHVGTHPHVHPHDDAAWLAIVSGLAVVACGGAALVRVRNRARRK